MNAPDHIAPTPVYKRHGFEITTSRNPIYELETLQRHVESIRKPTAVPALYGYNLTLHAILAFRLISRIDIDLPARHKPRLLIEKFTEAARPYMKRLDIKTSIEYAWINTQMSIDKTGQDERIERARLVRHADPKDIAITLFYQFYVICPLIPVPLGAHRTRENPIPAKCPVADEATREQFSHEAQQAGLSAYQARYVVNEAGSRYQRNLLATYRGAVRRCEIRAQGVNDHSAKRHLNRDTAAI